MADETTKPKTADQLTQEAVVLLKASIEGDDAAKDKAAKAVADVMKPALDAVLKLGTKANVGFTQDEANAFAAVIHEAQKTTKEGEKLTVTLSVDGGSVQKIVSPEEYALSLIGKKLDEKLQTALAERGNMDRSLGGQGYQAKASAAFTAEITSEAEAINAKFEKEVLEKAAEYVSKVEASNAAMGKLTKDVKPETLDAMKASAAEIAGLTSTAMDARIAAAKAKEEYAASDAGKKPDQDLSDVEKTARTAAQDAIKTAETAAANAEKAAKEKFDGVRKGYKGTEQQLFDKVVHAAIDKDRDTDQNLEKYKTFLKSSQGSQLGRELTAMVATDRLAEDKIETTTSQQLKAAAGKSGKGDGVADLVVNHGAKLAIGAAALTAAAAAFVPNKETVGEDGKPAQKKMGFFKKAVIAVGAVLTLGLAAAAIAPESTASIARKVPGGGHVADVLARRAAQAATGAARA